MRKNLIPLLAIALVIAGLCTILFYGMIADRFSPGPEGAKAAPTVMLVAAKTLDRGKVLESADLKSVEGACPAKCFTTNSQLLGRPTLEAVVEGQPFTEDLVAKRSAGSSPSATIPVGQRAVTLHAADSSGVVKMIRSGDRIDLQVIGSVDPQSPVLSIRRVWHNIEVLNTAAPDLGSSHTGRPVITVLLPPADAEQLSLADTTSRIRVVLRNREEDAAAAAQVAAAKVAAVKAAAVSAPAPATPAPATPAAVGSVTRPQATVATPAPEARPHFLVRLVSVQPENLAGLGAGAEDLQPQVRSVSRAEVEAALAKFEDSKTAHVLGSRPLALSGQREATFTLGADGERIPAPAPGTAGVRLRIRGLPGERWRVEPEAHTGGVGALAARRAETESTLPTGQAWLVSGLLEHKEGRPVLPGQGGSREPRLLLLVTPVAP